MSGIFILPVWIYCSIYNVFLAAQGSVFVTAITFILTAGRFLGLCVESWCVFSHLSFLLAENAD